MAESTSTAPQQVTGDQSYSRPIFDRSITLNSEQAKRVFSRQFRQVVRSLYAIDAIFQIIGSPAEIDAIEKSTSKLIENCATDIQKEKNRLNSIRDQQGINELPRYSNPIHEQITIVSPRVAQFTSLLENMDSLMQILDSLWLTTIFDNKQRADGIYQWQQRLLRLSRQIVGTEKSARAAARHRGLEAEIPSEEPEVDVADEELDALNAEAIQPVLEKLKQRQ